jgi:sugar lactone lactonase YvrE
VFNMTFSHDPKEKYLLVADGTNDTVWILNRSDGKQVGSFGGNGRYAGQLHWIDAIAMDSKGNVYTGEVEDGKRIQKFVLTNGDGKSTQPHPTTSYK